MNEPLVLIHGFTDSAATWRSLVPLLERQHRVIAVTLLGHDGHDLPLPEVLDDPLTAVVDDLERQMDAAGIGQAHLVGNSLGGWMALELAARDRASTIVAFSPGNGWEDEDAAVRRMFRRFTRSRRLSPVGARYAETIAARRRLRRIALRDYVARPERLSPDAAAQLIRGASACPLFEPWSSAVQAGRFRSSLEPIGVPVRIAWGTEDRMLPRRHFSARFAQVVPDAEWLDLEGLGHLPQHDDPQLVGRIVLEWTARHGRPAVRSDRPRPLTSR